MPAHHPRYTWVDRLIDKAPFWMLGLLAVTFLAILKIEELTENTPTRNGD